MTVSLTGYGRYVPERTITGPEIAERSGIPEEVVVEKMGVEAKHVCPSGDDHDSSHRSDPVCALLALILQVFALQQGVSRRLRVVAGVM